MDNSYGLAQLHEQLLIIMDDIDRVCRENDIQYTLSDGSLLGAIRHKGFIPWDDDMDIVMVRDDFERFKTVYEKEKRKDFVIGGPCNLATYSVINPTYDIPGMVKKEGTIINPWVSIFPMDHAPKNAIVSNIKTTVLRLLSGMLGKPSQYANFSKTTRIKWDITTFFGKMIGYDNARKWYDYLCVSSKENESEFYSCYAYNCLDTYNRYPKKLFKNTKDITFENRIYKGITEYDEYLTIVYGDYMTPLPPEKRNMRHLSDE